MIFDGAKRSAVEGSAVALRSIQHKSRGAPGLDFQTWDPTTPLPPCHPERSMAESKDLQLLFVRSSTNPGVPQVWIFRPGIPRTLSRLVILSEAWRSRRICGCSCTCFFSTQQKTLGAPGLDFQTWDTTNPVPPCHPERSAAKSKDLRLLLHFFLLNSAKNPGCPRSGFSDLGYHEPCPALSS